MHVVQALASLDVGGSELVALETTQHLRATGHRVSVLAADGALAQQVLDSGAELLAWPIGRKRISTLRYVGQLRQWLNINRPDIVHAHSRLPAWICYLALKQLPADKRPVFITSMHGQYSVNRYSAIMARGDYVIAVSRHIRDFTLQHYPQINNVKIHVIYAGINKSLFPFGYQPTAQWWQQTITEFPALKDKRILLLPGRLSRYKGHAAFIELIADLSTEFNDIHGVVLGRAKPGSHYVKTLVRLAAHKQITQQLTFVGVRTDMRDWMAASSLVFNLCSNPPEAFGRIVPEALSLGVPVLAWNHGGVKQVLEEMFPAGAVVPDEVPALLRKSREFLQCPPVIEYSGAFSLEPAMQQTLALYGTAVNEGLA